MNWGKVKELYPNSYDDMREEFRKSELKLDDQKMREFLHKRGFTNTYPFWIKALKAYERKLEQDRIDNEVSEKGYYEEDGTMYSGCCGAVVYDDTDICSDCKEHV